MTDGNPEKVSEVDLEEPASSSKQASSLSFIFSPSFFPFAVYAIMCLLLALITIPTWGWTYWDFGDGNYMYIARRVREGLTLYRDVLAPQPPLHTYGGVLAQSIGESLFGSALYGVRAYCLLVRMVMGLMVMLLALRYFKCPMRALTAAAIYLTMPIGFWWSLGYQSENLEIVFLLSALFLLISWSPRQAALAGVFSAMAAHCNMTGMPYLVVNIIFLLFRMPRLAVPYAATAAGTYALIAILTNVATDGYFISNVLLNQVGTFPRTDILQTMNPNDSFLQYAWRKVSGEGMKVIELEGGMILTALAGVALAVGKWAGDRRDPQWLRTEFLAWSMLGMLLSICFTAKGGTVNYIFVIGEPLVALFAAHAVVLLFGASLRGVEWWSLSLFNTGPFLRLLLPALVLFVMYAPAVLNIRSTLKEQQVELPQSEALELRMFIETYAKPGDTILAPPFYAFMTNTNVAAELAENYIWQIKYMNEMFDAEAYGKPTEDGVEKMRELAQLLRERKASVVLLDMDQTGRVQEVKDAIAEHYVPAEPAQVRTRNTRLGLYIPRSN